jgi:hypothetical protein
VKNYGGGGARLAPPFLTAVPDWGKYSQLHAHAYLPQEKQLYRRPGGPQIRSGRYGEEKNLLPLLGIEPRLLGLVRSLVAISTELYWNEMAPGRDRQRSLVYTVMHVRV